MYCQKFLFFIGRYTSSREFNLIKTNKWFLETIECFCYKWLQKGSNWVSNSLSGFQIILQIFRFGMFALCSLSPWKNILFAFPCKRIYPEKENAQHTLLDSPILTPLASFTGKPVGANAYFRWHTRAVIFTGRIAHSCKRWWMKRKIE